MKEHLSKRFKQGDKELFKKIGRIYNDMYNKGISDKLVIRKQPNTYKMSYWKEQIGAGWDKDCKQCKAFRRQYRRLLKKSIWFGLAQPLWCGHTNTYKD